MRDTEHQCPYCELRFLYLTELKDHVGRDHPDHRGVADTLEPHEFPHAEGAGLGASAAAGGHQCPRCELRFAFTTELRDHLGLEHTAAGVG
jgi:hypothetical protein